MPKPNQLGGLVMYFNFNGVTPVNTGILRHAVKQAWVNALRSGEYQQTKGALCRRNDNGDQGWCCLGVLTNLAANGVFVSTYDDYDDETIVSNVPRADIDVRVDPSGYITFNGGNSMPPERVSEWAFSVKPDSDSLYAIPVLSRDNYDASFFSVNGAITEFATLNDAAELTFDQIADLVQYFL